MDKMKTDNGSNSSGVIERSKNNLDAVVKKETEQSVQKKCNKAVSSSNEDAVKEVNGPKGLEPTRYGDWESKGRCYDF